MSEEAERLYEQALALEPEDRTAFLEEACRADPRLHQELVSLLEQAEAADEFFDVLTDAVLSVPFPTGGGQDSPQSMDSELDVSHTIGQYRILSRIGSGGMGTVYRAHDTRLDREVALKFLPPHMSNLPGSKEQLLVEARAAAALDHPNVCSIYEIGQTDDGRPFIAMARYEGETLKERLVRGSLPPEEAVATAIQIARGLAAAHARGISHRDVKPANVILGADGMVRLLDFGLAQATDVIRTHSGMTPGTVAYMSPEQARGDPLDQRTDLWSLGVVLYEMLTGARPFRGADDRTLLQAILHEDPEPISKRRPEVPEPLARVVERLLRKDPGTRYGSAAEVLGDLARALPSGALPPQPRILTRRRKALLAASTTALMALVGAALWLPGREGEPVAAVASAGPEEAQRLRHQTRNVAAYELYLRASDPTLPRSESGVRQAMGYFQQAIAVDSTYAPAHAGLALFRVRLGRSSDRVMSLRRLYALAGEAAMKAVALDDSLAEAHYALARVRLATFDFVSAEIEIRRAIALDPTDHRFRKWLAELHIWAGRPAEALAEARRGLETDPLSPYANEAVARALFANGHYDEALKQLERILAIQPPLPGAAAIAGQCYAKKRMWPEAIAALRPRAEGDPLMTAFLGHTLARAEQKEEANRILANLLARQERTGVGAFEVAVVYSGLGDFDQAFAWLDRSVDDLSLPVEIMDPTFEDLHDDPRFERLRRRLGLQNL